MVGCLADPPYKLGHINKFIRIINRPAERRQAVLANEGDGRGVSAEEGGRAKARRKARSTCLTSSAPASRVRRSAKDADWSTTNRLLNRLKAWSAVVETVRRGATWAASGQSNVPKVGSWRLRGLYW